MFGRLRAFITAAVALVPSAGLAQVQVNQTFVPQGPAPGIGMDTGISNSGAVQAILTDPALGRDTIFLGSTNGGIWRTTNGGASWTPLTDHQASLSIASLGRDVTDPSGKTLIAGIGATSNGTFPWLGTNGAGAEVRGGARTGLLYSTDGGDTWSAMGTTTLNGLSVVGVAARGNMILAATFEPKDPGNPSTRYGLYMSTNRGQSFSLVSGPLPSGPVTSLVADPTNQNIFYAAVSNTVYQGTLNTTGITWTAVSPQFSGGNFLRLAASNGSVALGVIASCNSSGVTCPGSGTGYTVTGLFWSNSPSTSSSSWKSIPPPPTFTSWGYAINNINQASANFAIAIDPKHREMVYVSGDEGPGGEPGPLPVYRINVGSVSGTTCPPQTCTPITGATAAVNDTMFPNSSVFYGGNHFGEHVLFQRLIVNSQGAVVSPNGWNGVQVTCNGTVTGCDNLIAPNADSILFVLNRANPSLIAIAGQNVYVGADTAPANAPSVNLTLTSVGGPPAPNAPAPNVSALAYGIPAPNNTGTSANPNALLAGVALLNSDGSVQNPGQLWFGTVGSSLLAQLTNYAGQAPSSVVFDPNSPSSQTSPGQIRFYVADGMKLWYSQNGSAAPANVTFGNLTSNLSAGFRPTSLEFISNNGVNALLVGGISATANAQSPITVADSDTNGNLSGWRSFGSGLPNTLISQMSYNPIVDVLAVATVGRGAWTLYDVTSYFPQATVLQFGLANNDSRPDASFLTDGTNLNGTGFSRPLNKYGTGTLTIAGNATYTGGTTIFGGVLQLGNGGMSGSILGNVAFCSDASNSLCDPSTNKMLVFNRSDTYAFDGAISGPGQVVQFGTGKTILTAASTYSGPTYVLGGTLSVNGSIASSVFVDAGGTLGGNGTVGPTTILAGGTLSPGNSVGTLTVNGNLVFAAASFYLVQVQGNTADRVNVSGTATLAGTVGVSNLGGNLTHSYTIVSASAGLNGTFNAFAAANLPAFITANLAYTPTDVDLILTSGIGLIAGLTRNQSAVAAALDTSFNSGGGTLPALFGLAQSQLPAALDMLSGEGVSGAQETAFGAAGMFTSMMMDQGAFWRNGETIDVNGVTFAGEPLSYAPSKKSKIDHPAFKALLTKEPPMLQPRWRAWLTGFDGTAKLAGEAGIGSATLLHNTGGLAAGLDYQFAPDLLAGFAMGGSSSNFSVRDRITSGNLEGEHFGGYAVKTWREVYHGSELRLTA